MEVDHNGISFYIGTIISNWEGTLELDFDKKKKKNMSMGLATVFIGKRSEKVYKNMAFKYLYLMEVRNRGICVGCELGFSMDFCPVKILVIKPFLPFF